jgi:hypothetical protein
LGQYYYAVTSLPQLFFESDNYPPMDEFLNLCRENLTGRDQRAIEDAYVMLAEDDLRRGTEAEVLFKEWIDWNLSLRVELASLRAQTLRWDSEELQDIERIIGTEEAAREIYTQDTPLAAEDLLERYRWAKLDALEVGHYFDLKKLIVYMIRLSILTRRAQFARDVGEENFSRMYETIRRTKI